MSNRHDRRAAEARARKMMETETRFYNDYVRHLPEVSFDRLLQPGMSHLVCFHDEWCAIYRGGDCNCNVEIKLHEDVTRQ